MSNILNINKKLIIFPSNKAENVIARKTGLNKNRDGSVRKINGKVYVDFIYLGERVRENSQLDWSPENARRVRDQLDNIIFAIKSGSFQFAKVFPSSKKKDYFSEKELLLAGNNRRPDQVNFTEFADHWYKLLKGSGRVTERTLLGYKSYLENYIKPYFGEFSFADLNKAAFDRFLVWSKNRCLRGESISNKTINKIFVPLKMICKEAAITYDWKSYNPMFGFQRLPESNSSETIQPFSLEEQAKIIAALPTHWRPYFTFAFSSGLRVGEQMALSPEDIDWSSKILRIRRAFTRDLNGKPVLGDTKNKYSRRNIKLTGSMLKPLAEQKQIYDRFGCQFFFCSTNGERVDASNLRHRVWVPTLESAGVEYREMKQTRHSFATNALSYGENPLWIANVMGHCNADMIIRVYAKYIENAANHTDGSKLDDKYDVVLGKLE